MKQKKNVTAIVLVVGMVLMLVGSILAQSFHSSGNKVKISKVSFETETGTLSGILYIPKGVDASNPAPTLVTTHGYLNSAEMQDAPAIEMSRRGFVVLALDMYDHGHSKGNADNTGGFMNFWPTSVYDAVQYMYGQDYVLKDENGNGMIAVSGHSMGGFSSTMALYYDELFAGKTGIRMIEAGLSAGSDYGYTGWLGLDVETGAANFNGRTIGKIAAHYDEFFFNAEGDTGTVNYKDYVSTPAGQVILENENPQADTWYNTSDGGKRIIYEPYEIHPWNHFSKTTTARMIQFYRVAFDQYYGNKLQDIDSNNQIWFLKEWSECIALVGFFLFVVALALILLETPFFGKAKTGVVAPLKAAESFEGKLAGRCLFIVTMMIPAIIFPTIYDNSMTSESMAFIRYAADFVILLSFVAMEAATRGEKEQKTTWFAGSVMTLIAGLALRALTGTAVFNTGKTFQAPSVNSIVDWALICAAITTIVLVTVYLFGKKKEQGVTLAHYGIAGKCSAVCAAFLVALIAVFAGYVCVFIADGLLKVDFRIWTFAVKTFEPSILWATLKYLPFFFIYYFAAGAAAISNTNTEKMQGAWGYIVACLTNMGGITIWLILQYGKDFATGHAFYPGQALSGILLFALVPTLAIASVITKLFYKKTGNIYTAAFLNTMLMTLMTVANTAVYFQMR